MIVPDEIDTKLLMSFKKLITSQVKKGQKFVIVTGGGKLARRYQAALKATGSKTHADLDWVGIAATVLNAQFIKLLFGGLACPDIATNPEIKTSFSRPILLAGGYKPGWSTDTDAMLLARTYGANTVINLSNIGYLYNKDPNKFPDAQKIERISWAELLKITGTKWTPGANTPFDPIAAAFAQKHGYKAIIASGKDMRNLSCILYGKKFKGTVIS